MDYNILEDAIHRCYRLAKGLYGSDYKPSYYCPRTKEEVIECLEALLDSIKENPRIVGIDIESNYVKEFGERMGDYWHKDYRVWCIGFSTDDYQAFCIPFDPDPYLAEKFGLTSIYEEPRIYDLVKEIARLNCVAHSTSDALGLGAKYEIYFKDYDDTLLIAYALDDQAGDLGVDDLARFYTEEGDYKKLEYSGHVAATIEELDWDDLTKYCCHDTDIERRLYFILRELAIQDDVWKGYQNVIKISSMIGIRMTLNGVAMNKPHLEKLIQDERNLQAPFVKEFYERPEVLKCFEFIKQTVKANTKHPSIKKLSSIEKLSDVKISKSWVLEILLYDVCKFPCLNQTEKGDRGTNADDLEKVKGKVKQSERLIDIILEIKKIDKKLSTYLLPYVEPKIKDIEDLPPEEIKSRWICGKVDRYEYIKDDGFIHPRFNMHLCRSGRSSSDRPNCQNIISDILIKMAFVSRVWKSTGKRGHIMLPDFSQHEVRTAAWLCGDVNMIKSLDLDFHTINQSTQAKILGIDEVTKVKKEDLKVLKNKLYHQLLEILLQKDSYGFDYYSIVDYSYSEIMKILGEDGDPKLKLLSNLWEEEYQKKRTTAKGSTFGPLFGQKPPAFAKMNEITLAEAEVVFEMDRKLYSRKHEYFDEEKKKMRKNGFVQSIFGKKRHLRYSSARSDGELNELDRQGINTLVQGPSSDLGILSMGECMSVFDELEISDRALGCMTIHDSLFFDYDPSLEEMLLSIVPEIMETYPEKLLGPGPCKFKAEVKYGENWGELKKKG